MPEVRVLHNPKCSKSRGCLQILKEHGISTEIVLYLEETPDRTQLEWIWDRLGRSMLRPEAGLDSLAREQVLDALQQNPSLIERPIVIWGERVLLARPPEKVLELLMERQ